MKFILVGTSNYYKDIETNEAGEKVPVTTDDLQDAKVFDMELVDGTMVPTPRLPKVGNFRPLSITILMDQPWVEAMVAEAGMEEEDDHVD